MAGTWTDPKTWVDGETPTGSQFNTHIRDNLNYLKGSPSFESVTTPGNITASGSITAPTVNAGALNANGDLNVGGGMNVNGSMRLCDAAADTVQIVGLIVQAPLRNYTETGVNPAISGGALTIDCNLGTYFAVGLNQNCSVTIANPPAIWRVLGVTIVFSADGAQRTITWPGTVRWPGGIPPTMTATAGRRDIITLITYDGGTSWLGIIAGQNYT